MKTSILLCLATITGMLAAEPYTRSPNNAQAPKADTLAGAQAAVQTQIVSRLQPHYPPFSRAMPMLVLPSYQVVEHVGNEDRLPFTVSIPKSATNVSGYVRLTDNAIFIFRPETKDYIPSNLDPRFAPAKEVQIAPVRPT